MLVLPIPNAHFIWYCAWFAVPSAIYAYAHPATSHFAPIPIAVFATSLLYWRNPIYNSWRRNLDIVVVSAGLTQHICYAVTTPGIDPFITRTYISLIGISIMFYVVSQYYLLYRHSYWPATYTHAMIHVTANIANFVLYYGINKSIMNM
jgi:hypothetical protein